MHISKVQDVNVQTERTEEYKAPTEETAWSRIKKALGPVAVVGVVIAKFLREAQIRSFAAPEISSDPVEVRRHDAADDLGLHATVGMAVCARFCPPFARP